ncbi:MAG TPA: C1 family peptidase [Candidatus Saccharimonadales bacterium]|nr:C1 family peptidase [Candidatus Saccharimonadales bacterium]
MRPTLTPKGHGLGWISDLPDQRDYIYEPPTEMLARLPTLKKVDLRPHTRPVFDQGQLGSCTANALSAAFDFDRAREGKKFMAPSRLFIYWNERDIEGTVTQDSGARIRDGVKVLVKLGAPPERDWEYDISKFTEKPPAPAFATAKKNQALSYHRIVTPHSDPTRDMLACLAAGYPFVTGISVYESFESAAASRTGHIPMPKRREGLLGGHAILIVGYDAATRLFTFQNSWGTSWGDKGFGYLPFAYLTSRGLASDMWLIKTVEV